MPISLADIRSGKRKIEVETLSGTVNIVYRLGEVTDAAITDRDKPGFAGVIAILVSWLESWDVLDGEAMYPITEESLRELPRAFLLDIYGAINGDVSLRPTKRGGSFGAG
jgi:hypothetical protein